MLNELMKFTSRVPYANPLVGAGQAIIPRDWEDVKASGKSMADIANKAGVPFSAFETLPEPLQKDIHKQVVMSDPLMAEAVPGNYNIINGEFVIPSEKDAFIKENLNKSPTERAKLIGSALQNKYPSPRKVSINPVYKSEPNVNIEDLNSILRETPTPVVSDYSYDQSGDQIINELNAAIKRHAVSDVVH
jgi:hypothetical protein